MTEAQNDLVTNKPLQSCIYEGWVRHRRFTPVTNIFKYKVFMMYLDLAEIPEVLKLSSLWGSSKWSIAKFNRSDFFGEPSVSLDESIRDYVNCEIGWRPNGPIRMLANLRYFGYITNPLTVYYCFDEAGESVQAIVANVTNTPWGESHAYVLKVNGDNKFSCQFVKQLHVSPFNPMSMWYRWHSNSPDQQLAVHLENWQNPSEPALQAKAHIASKVMDATLTLSAKPISSKNLNRLLIAYPLMTVKVIVSIYWQAVRLALKRAPFYSHPRGVAKKVGS